MAGMMPSRAGGGEGLGGGAVAVLAGLLLAALKALADAGHGDAACRFAGRACVGLRHDYPAEARRFDVLLHRLTPKLDWGKPG